MGSVGLLLVYHIFDIIRERISHMDDGEKDVQNSHASNEKNLGCLGRIGGYTTLCYRVYMGLLYPIIGIPMKQPV